MFTRLFKTCLVILKNLKWFPHTVNNIADILFDINMEPWIKYSIIIIIIIREQIKEFF